ncbi:hypothetical protein T484DRAFT_1820064, partial [Baffinella frigidus]
AKGLSRLSGKPSAKDIDLCGNCGDCKENFFKSGTRCPHCLLQDDMDLHKGWW